MTSDPQGVSNTVMFTGTLPFALLVGALLAVPVSLFLLRLYRRAVQKAMRASAGAAPPSPPGRGSARLKPDSPLQLRNIPAGATPARSHTASAAYGRAIGGPWRVAIAYAAAGAGYAIAMTAGWLLATKDPAIVWIKVLLLFWTYFWPAMLAIVLVAAYDRSRRARVFGAYFLVLLAIAAVAALRNPESSIPQILLYWILIDGPPTILLLAFLWRPIRAVGPLVLAFMVAVAIGSQSVLTVAGRNEGTLRVIAEFGFGLGLNAAAVFAGMMLVGVLAFALLGWPLLRLLGRSYQEKRLSDQSIMLDAVWLLFGVEQSIGLAFEAPGWILTGLAAFAVYRAILAAGFRWMRGREPAGPTTQLLQLRVFALGKRSEQLFDKLRKHWQYAGSISMIAGPDLVTATVEPHEFLDFLSGRLGRQFVTGKEDLERRMALMDREPDPDGRYRINEFFCHADTWQMTMEQLAATSDAVLLDLRSFSAANQGVLFELGHLLDSVDLRRVVLLVDQTTERAFLESTLADLWQKLSADSPNQSTASPEVRLFSSTRQSERELGALLGLLMQPISSTTPFQRAGTAVNR